MNAIPTRCQAHSTHFLYLPDATFSSLPHHIIYTSFYLLLRASPGSCLQYLNGGVGVMGTKMGGRKVIWDGWGGSQIPTPLPPHQLILWRYLPSSPLPRQSYTVICLFPLLLPLFFLFSTLVHHTDRLPSSPLSLFLFPPSSFSFIIVYLQLLDGSTFSFPGLPSYTN